LIDHIRRDFGGRFTPSSSSSISYVFGSKGG
jgi:hypothetical protein